MIIDLTCVMKLCLPGIHVGNLARSFYGSRADAESGAMTRHRVAFSGRLTVLVRVYTLGVITRPSF